MKKHVFSFSILILIILLLTSIFTACGRSEETADPAESASEAASSTDSESPTALSDKPSEAASSASMEDYFADQSIGVITGSVYDQLVEKYLSKSQVEYFNSNSDLALALQSGKISAFVLDEPSSLQLFQEYPEQGIYTTLEKSSYAFLFPKNTEKSETLQSEINEYLSRIQEDGTAQLLEDIWFGADETLKTVDYSNLSGENGSLRFAVCTDVGAPFAYMKDNIYVGYDIDMAVRFCREYGYSITVVDSNLSGMLSSITSGKCDFGASSVAITDERKESMDFSDPNYTGSIILVTMKEDIPENKEESAGNDTKELSSQFSGKCVAVLSGSCFDQLAENYLPDSSIEYMDSFDDITAALDAGTIDTYIADKAQTSVFFREYPDQYIYTTLESAAYAYIFPKNIEKSNTLRQQMNEFLSKIQADGTLEELEDIWFSTNESLQIVDYSNLSAENGTLKFAVSTDLGEPFAFIKDEQYVGFDIDIAVLFCREYGYGIEIVDTSFSDLLSSVSRGECDFGGSSINITDERKEIVDFSEPHYLSGIVLVARQEKTNSTSDSTDTSEDDKITTTLYAGKSIGVLSGSVHDQIADESLIDSEIVYFNTVADMALALENGSIDAYLTDTPLAQQMIETYEEQNVTLELESDSYCFVFEKNNSENDTLREQFDSFITTLRADGTASDIAALWLGSNEKAKVVELDDLVATNGTLRLAVSTSIGEPFVYIKNGRYAGLDIDIAARFCREYGYGLEIVDSSFNKVLVAVSSGKCDFGASCIKKTEERMETLNFSVPYYEGSVVLVVKDAGIAKELVVSDPSVYEDLRGKKIGVVTGMICDVLAQEKIPECEVVYLNSNADLALALESGKIDAYMADQPISRLLLNEYPNHSVFAVVSSDSYGYIFTPERERSDTLLEQMNEFLTKIRKDGTLKELDSAWFGQDETRKIVDYSGLTGENGTISFATTSSTGEPFCYLKNDQYIGYDIDIVVRFCREYGYDLKIVDCDFNGMLAAVAFGKCDFGGSCITITEERKESMNFSDPNYMGGLVLVVKDSEAENEDSSILSDPSVYEELRGCTIACLSGSIFDKLCEENVPECEILLYNNGTDVAVALDTGKADAYITDEPVAQLLMNEYEDQEIFAFVEIDEYAYIYQKDNAKSDTLRLQMNEFLQKLRDNGTIDELKSIWLGTDENAQVVDYSDLSGENGTLRFAMASSSGAPFCYIKDEQYAGYDIDIAVRFCREYGYGLEFVDTDFSGVIANVASGKCDFGASGISVTEERKETMSFSDPNYTGGVVIVTKSLEQGEDSSSKNFLVSVKNSFEKTFLRENRWKLFCSGIGITLLITVIAVLCGTVLAFLLFLLYRKDYIIAKVIVNVMSDILQKTPVVVILMILYYIIFGRLSLDSMWVSCIGFALIFTGSVIGLLKVAVGAIDDGQMEAALALGYTDTHAFLRVILPQSLEHFLPGYKSEIVSLIKGTSVVGYIAVQDLTKVSDIVRSRTYEAFFPLIATAVIYYVLAWILTLLVRRIQIQTNPKHRSRENVLKGVKTK